MPGIKYDLSKSPDEQLKYIKKIRKDQKADDLCFGNTKDLLCFQKTVFNYKYATKPNYEYLRSLLF